jgi:prepilin-type N-terminal cleavage/methylation domain-containing protein
MQKVKNLVPDASRRGFTIIELLVVVAIMGMLASVLVINLAGQRASRDIKIAENQLVTDIRKTQSYTLSSTLLPNGQDADYYLLKFDMSKPSQYKIQALYNVSVSPQLMDVQTINLPPDIQIASITPGSYPISVARSLAPTAQNFQSSPLCGLIAFAAPFGKVIFNDGCAPLNPTMPYQLSLSDDYYSKIVNFQNNVVCNGVYSSTPSPSVCTASTDSIMTITLTDLKDTVSKTITINGITGGVSFN